MEDRAVLDHILVHEAPPVSGFALLLQGDLNGQGIHAGRGDLHLGRTSRQGCKYISLSSFYLV